MSMTSLFFTAAGVGLAIAAPVGPMGMLCIRRTLTGGPRAGLAIGLGIATGDALYGLIAALGLVSISQFMLAYDRPLHLLAGLFLLYLGVRTLLQKAPADTANGEPDGNSNSKLAQVGRAGALRAYASSLLLTLTNPQTVIMFAALFTTLAPRGAFSSTIALTTVGGVFCGSIAWWCFLVSVVSLARHAIGSKLRLAIDRFVGIMLAAFGVVEIRRAL
ncbi:MULTISPECIES: LysE family translocator [Paraburkholderia]|jgi:threonine/homoserine/homoserine lactone efflux protein|uniref:Threonine/homoserine/homoserine lactone efflux protein n=2 Tax=Paraburkholderia graminis TaxID=60548 RepID=A0ABD5C9C8_9BURK|nr:LysE family transporter [Paraburkholderia graminis]MDQ0621830.1 threonine/homoserine/homoserine lactone efflux protein [Paraburkholderia graminis]MDR6201481.1 threonine/homoserine/homoserine lactone efflux protein [Paraburkholderia graminis]